MRPPRLIAFDLDGTALTMDGDLLGTTRQALLEAHQQGYRLVVVTGRPGGLIPGPIRRLPLTHLITDSGAVTTDYPTGAAPDIRPMDPGTALRIHALAKGQRAAVNVSFADRLVWETRGVRLAARHLRQLTAPSRRTLYDGLRRRIRMVRSVRPFLAGPGGPVLKLDCEYPSLAAKREQLVMFQAMGGVEAVSGSGSSIELTAAGVTKGAALARVCQREQISAEEVVAIGDGPNDLSLRPVAGLFVATANAHADVLAIADEITTDCNNDGLGQVVRKLLKTRTEHMKGDKV